eukprot:7583-Pelagomonas_calceolata.AAC.4
MPWFFRLSTTGIYLQHLLTVDLSAGICPLVALRSKKATWDRGPKSQQGLGSPDSSCLQVTTSIPGRVGGYEEWHGGQAYGQPAPVPPVLSGPQN